MNIQHAIDNHLRNIEARYSKSLAELAESVEKSGLTKFGEKRDFLKKEFGMGHGDANAVVNFLVGNKQEAQSADPLAEIYVGPKVALRGIHDAVMTAIEGFGEFEVAPKKGYVSLRRKKQFAMVGPATKTQIEIGLNMKGVEGTERLIEQPAGGMCQFKVRLSGIDEVDADLIGWLRAAYESAG